MSLIHLMKNGMNGCDAFTENGWMHYNQTPYALLQEWCISCGSNVEGRMEAFRQLTGHKMKAPVLVSERAQIIYFPTASYKHESCIWINYRDVFQFKKINEMETEIQFVDGKQVIVPFNIRLIRGQMKRCQEFLDMMYESSKKYLLMQDAKLVQEMLQIIYGDQNESKK